MEEPRNKVYSHEMVSQGIEPESPEVGGECTTDTPALIPNNDKGWPYSVLESIEMIA